MSASSPVQVSVLAGLGGAWQGVQPPLCAQWPLQPWLTSTPAMKLSSAPDPLSYSWLLETRYTLKTHQQAVNTARPQVELTCHVFDQQTWMILCPNVSGAGHVSPSAANIAIITTECTSPLVTPWPALYLLRVGCTLDNCSICRCSLSAWSSSLQALLSASEPVSAAAPAL